MIAALSSASHAAGHLSITDLCFCRITPWIRECNIVPFTMSLTVAVKLKFWFGYDDLSLDSLDVAGRVSLYLYSSAYATPQIEQNSNSRRLSESPLGSEEIAEDTALA